MRPAPQTRRADHGDLRCFLKTAASIPTRCGAIAAASPPMPPTINARMVAYRTRADSTTPRRLMLTALGGLTGLGRNPHAPAEGGRARCGVKLSRKPKLTPRWQK